MTNETLWVENRDATSGQNTLFFHEPDYVEWSFEHARKHFPCNELILNEAPARIWLDGFKYNRSAYYMLIERALSKGAPIDTIGMQYQASGEPDPKFFDPIHIYQVLDQYAKLGKPIQISEITIPSPLCTKKAWSSRQGSFNQGCENSFNITFCPFLYRHTIIPL